MAEKRLDIKITGDNSGFARAANSTVGILNRIGRLATIGIFGQQMFGAVRWAGEIKDAAIRLGTSAESFQAFQRAASQSGVSMEQLTIAFQNLERAKESALGGDASSGNSFARLGISLDELRDMNPEQLFDRVSRAIQGAGNNSASLATAIELMGKAGGPMIAAMRDGFTELAEEIKKAGGVLSNLQVDKLDAMGDRLDDLKYKAKTVFGQVAIQATGMMGMLASGGSTLAMKIAGYSDADIYKRQMEIFDFWGLVKDVKPKEYTPKTRQTPNYVNPAFQSPKSKYDLAIAQDALKAETATTSLPNLPSADALARVGGFRGGGGDSMKRELEKHSQLLKSIDQRLANIEEED